MEEQYTECPSPLTQHYLDCFDFATPQEALEAYYLLVDKKEQGGFANEQLNAYEEALALYPIDSQCDPDAAPSLLTYFVNHGKERTAPMVLMSLVNLASVNPEAASDVYTQCVNLGNFLSPEGEEALGVAIIGLKEQLTIGNVAMLGAHRRLRQTG